jgi:hypothetical protein
MTGELLAEPGLALPVSGAADAHRSVSRVHDVTVAVEYALLRARPASPALQ